MTTIAWDGTTLAADRCSWSGHAQRTVKKLHRFPDGIFAGCGDGAFVEAYAAFRRGDRPNLPDYKDYDVEKSHAIGVFISSDSRVWTVTTLGELLPFDETIFAHGGGHEFAWGALEAGATARQAIEIAIKRSDAAALGVDEMTLNG